MTALATNPKAGPHMFGTLQYLSAYDQVNQLTFAVECNIVPHSGISNRIC